MCWVKFTDWDATTFDNTKCEKQTKDLCGILLDPNTDAGSEAGYMTKGNEITVRWYQPTEADVYIDGYIQRINDGD